MVTQKDAYKDYCPFKEGYFRWTPHPVIVTIWDNKEYIRVLLYSNYTTITGWGVLLRDIWVSMLVWGSVRLQPGVCSAPATGCRRG